MIWTSKDTNWVEGAKTSPLCHPKNYKKRESRKIEGLVFHYTGVGHTDHDEGNARYFSQELENHPSAHLFVDDDSISQIMRLCDIAHHCGPTGKLKQMDRQYNNSNTIGIEMCCTDPFIISEKTKDRAAGLGAYLFILFGWKAEEVDSRCRRHWDITRKVCPAQMAGYNNEEWEKFKALIKAKILKATAKKQRSYHLVFDPTYYWEKYKDKFIACGVTKYDGKLMREHFLESGMKALWQGNAEFNPVVYYENNGDLRNAYGNDFPKYYEHYIDFGHEENRVHK